MTCIRGTCNTDGRGTSYPVSWSATSICAAICVAFFVSILPFSLHCHHYRTLLMFFIWLSLSFLVLFFVSRSVTFICVSEFFFLVMLCGYVRLSNSFSQHDLFGRSCWCACCPMLCLWHLYWTSVAGCLCWLMIGHGYILGECSYTNLS